MLTQKENFAEIMAIKKWQKIASVQFYTDRKMNDKSNLFNLNEKELNPIQTTSVK